MNNNETDMKLNKHFYDYHKNMDEPLLKYRCDVPQIDT